MFKAIKLSGNDKDKTPPTETPYRANTTLLKPGAVGNTNSRYKNRTRVLSKIPKKFFIAFVISIILLTFFVLFKSDFFSIKNIILKPAVLSCGGNTEIIKSSALLSKKIFSVSDENLEADLKKRYLCLDSVLMTKKLPSTIEVKLFERQPIFQITNVSKSLIDLSLPTEASESSSTATFSSLDFDIDTATISSSFLVDKTGLIYDRGNRKDLLNIYLINHKLNKGIFLKDNLALKIQKVLRKLKDLQLSSASIILIDHYLLIKGPLKMAFSLDKDIDREMASLQLILEAAKINSKVIDTVDLRFDKPIIIYLPRSR